MTVESGNDGGKVGMKAKAGGCTRFGATPAIAVTMNCGCS